MQSVTARGCWTQCCVAAAAAGRRLWRRRLQNTGSLLRRTIAASYPRESLASVDPMTFAANDFVGKHLRFYVTPTDSLVPTNTNALAFQSRFGSAADISTVSCTGPHLDPSCIQGEDIVKWFSQLESNAKP